MNLDDIHSLIGQFRKDPCARTAATLFGRLDANGLLPGDERCRKALRMLTRGYRNQEAQIDRLRRHNHSLNDEITQLRIELGALCRRCDTTPDASVGTDAAERHEADRPACCQGDTAE